MKVADLLKSFSDTEGALDLKSVIVELEAVTEEELDFRVEANLSTVPLISIFGILFSIELAIFSVRRLNNRK